MVDFNHGFHPFSISGIPIIRHKTCVYTNRIFCIFVRLGINFVLKLMKIKLNDMKKILLSLSVFMSLGAFAQVEIHMGADPMDISGTTQNIIISPDLVNNQGGEMFWESHFHVVNNTSVDQQWQIKRVKVNVPAGWSDQLCWPPECYNASGNVFITPHDLCDKQAPRVLNGTSDCDIIIHEPFDSAPCDTFIYSSETSAADIIPKITPVFNATSVAIYTYYVVDAFTQQNVDSLTLSFSYSAGIQDKKVTSNLVLSPNPADDFVSINLEGTESANIKIVDVLGNEVISKYVTGGTKLNTSDFRSGVYFVTINGDTKKTTTKKLVIRH